MLIELLRGDVNSLKVDAIVNPRAAAPGHDFTSTVVAAGGNLLCKFVIHAVFPRMGEGEEDLKLRNATWGALQRAEELAVSSVAFPCISETSFGFDPDLPARAMLNAAMEFREHSRSLQRAIFCAFSEDSYGVLEKALEDLSR